MSDDGWTTSGLDAAMRAHADQMHPVKPFGTPVETNGITGVPEKPYNPNYGGITEPGGITGNPRPSRKVFDATPY